MKICVCFTGLERTIEKTYVNISNAIFDTNNHYSILFVTWKNESVENFTTIFPQAYIHRIDEISDTHEDFIKWKDSIQMHVSWRRTYEPTQALFRYFQQIYLWKQAAKFLEQIKPEYDLFMRIRTDVAIRGVPVHPSYSQMKVNTLYFPSEPRHSIFGNHKGCPDYYFIGAPVTVIKALSILDYLHTYKVTYEEKNEKWFPIPTLEENIIQPETSMYLFLEGEKIGIEFLDNSIEVIR